MMRLSCSESNRLSVSVSLAFMSSRNGFLDGVSRKIVRRYDKNNLVLSLNMTIRDQVRVCLLLRLKGNQFTRFVLGC